MKCVLDDKGDLSEVRAQLEEQMVSGQNNAITTRFSKPTMPPEIILANHLIRQYLESVGLHKTASVLCTESGLPGSPVPEEVFKSTMSSVPQSGEKPLLQNMIDKILNS
ncbi:uncharacterized protein LOC117651804 isoform X2 [Thrips palmi]|nr:uncharacterized protein LOC117651804 isoform X2 [Thrips palmi]